jgi:hypothetical protein
MSLASLTPETLLEQAWEYGPAQDDAVGSSVAGDPIVWGTLRFAPESLPNAKMPGAHGRIFGFGHPNERRWSLVDGVLSLLRDDLLPTSRFDRCTTIDGRLTLQGPHLLENGGLHQLRAVAPLTAWPEPARLAIERRLADPSRPLVVIFNSMGNPLGENDAVRWEYFRFTADPAIDFLRFAEPLEPASWYLRVHRQVRQALVDASSGRPRIIVAGNSSGGYAAIRFGQWLARLGLSPDIRSISVNPQTAHSLPQRLHLWAREWDHFLPATMRDDVLKLTGRSDVDLAPYLAAVRRRRFTSVQHSVFYDCDNPVENYYVGLIADQPGVRLHGMPLGMSHVQGIAEMERRDVMKTALREAVDAAPSWRTRLRF